jgi:hypothetical protein
MNTQTKDEIIQRFNAITWHDAKLLSLSFYRTGSEEQIRISLQLRRGQGVLTPAELVFRESTWVSIEVDLEGKRVCADDISDADCRASSDWMMALSNQNRQDSFEEYLHFQIDLIPPGGTISILAKDFAFIS